MRILPFSISFIFTVALVWALNRPWGPVPAMGSFLSPQEGFWQNAETDETSNLQLHFPEITDSVSVYFDERLVPHVFAKNEADLFFMQGYLHAKYRLWQMEFQTRAAAGRLSEILGVGKDSAVFQFDRQMRRLGMVYGAKKAWNEVMKDPETSVAADSYAAGVNAYIKRLTKATLPFEYKLLGYQPEAWSSFKTALFLKYMSYDLAGGENDFELTNARSVLSQELFDLMYPISRDSLDPVVAKGTAFDSATVQVKVPALADSLYFGKFTAPVDRIKPNPDNGSNNWAVDGTKTASGRPILCNDPHLGLNLPSLWYEIQLTTPTFSAYGASFPGAPCVIIGFNDSCSFGFTNAMRDVRDYYTVEFKDASKKEYLFNNEWKPTVLNIDTIKIKGGGIFYDTVAYTNIGPVMYDASFRGIGKSRTDGKNFAVRWKAHDSSNELKLFYKLDHARNFEDYNEALENLACPGQNCIFATKSGDIAIWQQAVFPAKWKRQGDFVMPGTDSSFFWQGSISKSENPHMVKPSRGFVSSANQLPVDTTYPYYIGGIHDLYRGYRINQRLASMSQITPDSMKAMQTENFSIFARLALPVMLNHVQKNLLADQDKRYLQDVKAWDYVNSPDDSRVTIFNVWFDSLQALVWNDELAKVPAPYLYPQEATLLEAMLRDSAFVFYDNINTPDTKETLDDLVTQSLKNATMALSSMEKTGGISWAKFKDAGIRHLTRLEPLSKFHLHAGGGEHVINATKQFHGPSWRMIVHMTDDTEAYGIYPGGQSGNPGSRYYENFIDSWVDGKYYSLWHMKKAEYKDRRVLFTLQATQ